MKIGVILAYTCALISTKHTLASYKGPIHAPLDLISLEDISPEERKQIEYLEYKLRSKRSGSGSGDILAVIAKTIGQGLKKKIGQIARASVSASGHFSSSSSSSGHSSEHGHSYHHPAEHVPESHDHHQSFDWWSLKKSILNTLLQAVKAIKGGVLAVKGQLIKGSGKLISVKGRLISAKGESITQLGKNIASSAKLVPFHGHSSSGHEEYHSAPSAPEEIYHGSPSGPGPEYHVPGGYPPPHHPDADGLLILKKMPGHHHEELPPFKPLEPSGPSFGTIVGKFFSASTSLNPHKPDLFGHTASANIHDGLEEHQPPVPSTSYGVPFEETPSYVSHNFGDYTAADSKNEPSYVKADGSRDDKSAVGLQPNKNSFEYPTGGSFPSQSLPQNTNYQFSTSDANAVDLPNLADYPDGFPPSPGDSQSLGAPASTGDSISQIYYQQPIADDSLEQSYQPSPYLQSPKAEVPPRSATRFNTLDPFDEHEMRTLRYERPSVTKGLMSFRTGRPRPHGYEVVKSMSFELGPNGPKRLT